MVTQVEVGFRDLVEQQRAFFKTGRTKDLGFRIEQLKKLHQAIEDQRPLISDALKADLGKAGFDIYFEIAGILGEIEYALKHIKRWVKPQKVATPFHQFLSSAKVYSQPLGVSLIIGPWNYPFNLVFAPLVGAIAAGNCAVLKPSEIAPNSSAAIAKIVADAFDPNLIAVVEGGVEVSQALLSEKFDHIFFTGGTEVGKIVMGAAAKNLTPVTLELGGKNPCIVDKDVQLEYTAQRILWGKFINAGQTCTAPDYLLIHRDIKKDFLNLAPKILQEFYGTDPSTSRNYGRIVNQKHFSRLAQLLNSGRPILGGEVDAEALYIAPTLLDGVDWEDEIMQEEIFGPILPILEYTDLEQVIATLNEKPKPLSLYFFSKDKQKQAKVLQETVSGGACLNDTVMQLTVPTLPFGGVGASGLGRYHGKAGFDNFSYQRSVLNKSFRLDIKWRYYPKPRRKAEPKQ